MEIMIDIETMDTKAGGIILEIAAVAFHEGRIVDEFQTPLNLEESERMGFTANPITERWWEEQGGVPVDLTEFKGRNYEALWSFSNFILDRQIVGPGLKKREYTAIWAKGSMDVLMLRDYFERYGIPCPWKFYEENDMRTAMRVLNGIDRVSTPGTEHRALADARAQTEQLITARAAHAAQIERAYTNGYWAAKGE